MGPVIDAAQAFSVDVAVHLRGREGAVAEQFLDRPEVGAAFEEMRGERVPEPVRMGEHAPQRRRVEAAAAGGEEEGILGAARELRPRLAQVAREPVRCLLAERHRALLAALASDVHLLLLELDVGEVEPDGLGAAQPGRVDELDERAVPERQRPLAVQGVERRLDLGGAGRVRQPARPARRQRRVRYPGEPEREAEEAPHRRQLPPDRRRRQLARPRPAELGRIVGEDADVHGLDRRSTAAEPARELLDIDAIGAPCRLAQLRRGEEAFDCGFRLHAEAFAPRLASPAMREPPLERYADLFVAVNYYDPHVKRARVQHVAEESLDYIPPWFGERTLQLGEARAASISLSGPTAPHLFEDLDPTRLGRDIYPRVKEWMKVTNDRSVNWSIAPAPTREWAQLVHPDLEPAEALGRLWEAVVHVCRLDEADPAAAWRARTSVLSADADRLTERRFDAILLEGQGTHLNVGLLPTSRWIGGADTTAEGIEHMPNLPTEEVFTTPDPTRVDGVVRATMPLFTQGRVLEGIVVRFEGGRAVEIDADVGAEVLRTLTSRDEGGARLGELALVDREGRIGPLETVFYDTLLDENAASHLALGAGYEQGVGQEDRGRINESEIHLDFMIGGPEVDVTGITRDGERVPVLRDAAWQL